jgi:ubiquinone/menaquinone biosynthesis C-methylase UbiE
MLGSASCYGKPFFASLWVRALGERYPVDVLPFSSCTCELLQQLRQELTRRPGTAFADLGCGSGGITLWLARETQLSAVGVDRKQASIDIARRRISEWAQDDRVEFRCADFADTSLAANSVDAVISVDALSPGPDIDAALQECHRILGPDGRLIFTARQPARGTERSARVGPEWRGVLQRTGFELVRAVQRPDVSALWRSVYAQWIAHEAGLRAELPDVTVAGLLDEARRLGPTMEEDRPWFLITAVKRVVDAPFSAPADASR